MRDRYSNTKGELRNRGCGRISYRRVDWDDAVSRHVPQAATRLLSQAGKSVSRRPKSRKPTQLKAFFFQNNQYNGQYIAYYLTRILPADLHWHASWLTDLLGPVQISTLPRDFLMLFHEQQYSIITIFDVGFDIVTRLNPFARSWFYNATAVRGALWWLRQSHSVNYANHQYSPSARRRHDVANSILSGIVW